MRVMVICVHSPDECYQSDDAARIEMVENDLLDFLLVVNQQDFCQSVEISSYCKIKKSY